MYATLDIQSPVLLPINVATTPHHTTVHHLPRFVHMNSESTSGSSSLLILWSYGASILTPIKTPVILAIINTQDAEYEKKITMAWSTMQTSSSTSSGPTKPAIGSLGQFSTNSSPSKSQCKNYKYNLHHPHQSHHLHPSSSYTSTQPNQPTTKMQLSLTSLVSLLAAAQSASAWQSTSTTPPLPLPSSPSLTYSTVIGYADSRICNDQVQNRVLRGSTFHDTCFTFGQSMPGVSCTHYARNGAPAQACSGHLPIVSIRHGTGENCIFYRNGGCTGDQIWKNGVNGCATFGDRTTIGSYRCSTR
ncbi:uncharacterized protein QC763_509852 [Podospora pseudopauciseta]|uniref:Uncharacterized protein n=1 Tax=Podospora pseudopauciseta TaxID=2093780 RepID=A0ABR0HAF2_9PEZI|nr:hypothetical protein QC763_509852 [Podospora pseudopauciseta]